MSCLCRNTSAYYTRCNCGYNHSCGCQCNTTTTTSTTIAPCIDGETCEIAVDPNCIIYCGPDLPCYGIKTGDTAADILQIILDLLVCPTTTTTSTTTTSTTSTSTTSTSTTSTSSTTTTSSTSSTTSTSTTTTSTSSTTTTTTAAPCNCFKLVNEGDESTYTYIDCDKGTTEGPFTITGSDPLFLCTTQVNIVTGSINIENTGACINSILGWQCPTTTTTTEAPITTLRCSYTPVPGVPGGFQIDRNMDDLTRPIPEAYNYQLNDFTINGVNYATGQTLSITDISQVVFGTGLDGNTYIMNISDWMTSVSAALGVGFVFYDNMRVIDYPSTVTSYSINITRLGPGGGGPQQYYYSSANGYSINSPTATYGNYTCV